jgi:hypothetical protein
LIPNLRSIDFSVIPPEAYPWAHALLGPGIQEVTISAPDIEDSKRESQLTILCSSILRHSPYLPCLYIQLRHPSPAISRLLCGLHHLRIVQFIADEPITKQVGYHLANLPDLIRLHTNGYLTTADVYTTAGGQFPSLKQISFPITDWRFSTKFMDSMRCCFTHLTIYKCHAGIREPLSSFGAFIHSMYGHPSRLSLTHLELMGLVDSDHESSVYDVLKPLFSLSALRELNLYFTALRNLGDSWLSDAASAWSSLEHLGVFPGHGIVSKMMLTGLVPLIKKCPQLRSLSLPLSVEPVDPALLDGVYNTNIRRLSFLYGRIDSPLQVFHSLIRMFPNLRSIEFNDHHLAEVSRLLWNHWVWQLDKVG